MSPLAAPRIGWVGLSRRALAAAEKHVDDAQRGVRDEVGVLALHSGYANRFFPGTSVQHSRIRYVLLVAHQLDGLLRNPEIRRGEARSELRERELQLARQLNLGEPRGVIGGTTAKQNRLTALPPSAAYWSALGRWGFLREQQGAVPSLAFILSRWDQWAERDDRQHALSDDEHGRLDRRPFVLHHLPTRPPALDDPTAPMDFTLTPSERADLRTRLVALVREDGQPTLLSRLVAAGLVLPDDRVKPWDALVMDHADAADRAALTRARQGSAMAALLRGLYNALVETIQDEVDHDPQGTAHRERLAWLVEQYGADAERFSPREALQDGVHLGGLITVIEKAQTMLRDHGAQVMDARPWLASWEAARKGDRARLPRTKPAQDRRLGWTSDLAGPVTYRWEVVRSMLLDLRSDDGPG